MKIQKIEKKQAEKIMMTMWKTRYANVYTMIQTLEIGEGLKIVRENKNEMINISGIASSAGKNNKAKYRTKTEEDCYYIIRTK